MRITFLSHFPGRGGSTTMLEQLRKFFERQGHTVSIVVGNDSEDSVIKNYTVVPAARSWRERMMEYKRSIDQTRADVVYSISGKDELDVLRFLECGRVRHVFSLERHEYADIPFWLKQLNGYVELITANTPDVFEQIQTYGLGYHRELVVPYQLDPGFISAEVIDKQSESAKNRVDICFIGRLENFQKRACWLPEVIRLCKQEGKDFYWHIYGDGPCGKYLRRRVQENGCEGSVCFYGWVDTGALIRQLSNHDIFFLCSRWEGLPIAMVEAMLCGVACVVPSIPAGITFALGKGGGWLYDARSPRACVEALSNATGRPDLIWQKKGEARNIARSLFMGREVERQWSDLEGEIVKTSYNGRCLSIHKASRMRAVTWKTFLRRKLMPLCKFKEKEC